MGALLALDGIKILDFSRTEPGSFCSMVLGDLGADVIMIEAPPDAGARAVGFRQAIPGGTARKHRRYRAVNRNKRSISLNLKSEKARHIFYRLAEETDVIIEGFRPGVAERLGIDYRTVSRMNPGIVYCSMTGYGQDGPYSNLAGHDLNCIALGGALSLIGGKDGKPVIPLNLIADIGGGAMFAAVGILAALIARQSTGKGQHIDISLTDSVISLLTTRAAEYFEHGVVPGRGETALGGAYPYYNVYETADEKFIALACIEPWLWEEFCREIGREDFIPFHFQLEHMYHLAEGKEWENITSFLKQLFKTRSSDEWFGLFNQKDMPVSRVHSLSEVFADPQVLHRQMVAELEDPVEGRVKQAGIAIKLSDTPGRIRSLPPTPGEHTEEILTEIGYSQHSIAELRQETVIG